MKLSQAAFATLVALSAITFTSASAAAVAPAMKAADAPKVEHVAKRSVSGTIAADLGGTEVRVGLETADQIVYTIYKKSAQHAEVKLGRDAKGLSWIECWVGKDKATLAQKQDGKTDERGTGPTLKLCKDAVAALQKLAPKVKTATLDGWVPVNGAEFVLDVEEDRNITCSENNGKCKCKCDHGWNPYGGLFCASFVLVGSALGSDCDPAQLSCSAPSDSCK